MAKRVSILKFGIVLLVGILAACTRSTNESSKLSVTIPSSMKMNKELASGATDKLYHLVINITGSGINYPIVYQWDGHDSAALAAPPTSFELEVPTGSGRLIQVLAVYGSATNSGSMSFYYGDTLRDLAAATEGASVTLKTIADGNIVSGSVSGRYLQTADSGPTGKIQIKYSIAGKPAMIIDEGFIVNGWFNLFMLQGIAFTYELPDHSSLWSGPISLDSPQIAAENNVRVSLPVRWRKDYSSGSTTATWKAEEPEIYVYGWFGPGAPASNLVCRPSTFTSFSNMKSYAVAATAAGDPGSPLGLTLSNVFPTIAQLLSVDTPMTAGVISNGIAAEQGTCTAASELSSKMTVVQALWDGSGKDGAAIFYPPFKKSGSYGPFSSSATATDLLLSGELLPGIFPQVIDRIIFYKRVADDNWSWNGDSLPCDQILNGKFGFTPVAEVNLTAATFSATLALAATERNQSGTSIAVCSSKGGQIIASGQLIRNSQLSFGGGGGSGGPNGATNLAIRPVWNSAAGNTTANRLKIGTSVCNAIKIVSLDAAGNKASRYGSGNPQALVSVMGGTDARFYNDDYCGSPAGGMGSITVSYGGGDAIVYMKVNAEAVSFDLSVTDISVGGTALASNNFYGTTISMISATDIVTTADVAPYKYDCQSVVYQGGIYDAGDFVPMNPSVGSLGMPSSSGLSFYSDSACMVPASGSLHFSAKSTVVLYYRYSGSAASLDLAPTSGGGLTLHTANVNFTEPGPAAWAYIAMQPSFGAETCQTFRVMVTDDQGHPAPIPSSLEINPLVNGSSTFPTNSGFYDYSCANPTSMLEVAGGDVTSLVYGFRWTAPGTVAITGAMPGAPAGFSFMNFTGTVGPVALGQLVVLPQGLGYSYPNFVGYGFAVHEGEPFGMTIQARSPMGNMLVNFNDTDLGPSGLNLAANNYPYGVLSCMGLAWVNGVGTATCLYSSSGGFGTTNVDLSAGGGTSPYPYSFTGGHLRVLERGGGTGVYSSLATNSFTYYNGNCQPFLFSRSLPAPYVAGFTMTSPGSWSLSGGAGVTSFHTDSSCGSAAITQVNLTTGESAAVVYALFNGSVPSGVSADGSTMFDYVVGAPPSYSPSSPGVFTQYKLTMHPTVFYGGCSPLMVMRSDANGAASSGSSSAALSASFAANFYSDPACNNTLGSVSFSTESTKLVYVRSLETAYSTGSISISDGVHTGVIPNVNYGP